MTASKSIHIGELIKTDTLSDLIVKVKKGDGSGDAYDLTAVTQMKLTWVSADSQAKIAITGALEGAAALGQIRFSDMLATWTPPAKGTGETFTGWVTLQTASKFGFCRPSLSAFFRRNPL